MTQLEKQELERCLETVRRHILSLPGGVRKNYSLMVAMAQIDKITRPLTTPEPYGLDMAGELNQVWSPETEES